VLRGDFFSVFSSDRLWARELGLRLVKTVKTIVFVCSSVGIFRLLVEEVQGAKSSLVVFVGRGGYLVEAMYWFFLSTEDAGIGLGEGFL